MKIESVDIFPIRMRLEYPIPMSSGAIESTGNVLVRLETDSGLVGWGEAVEAPAMTLQGQADIIRDLEELTPVIQGADPRHRNRLWASMTSKMPAATSAVAALDIAIHDIVGKHLGVPVYELLGGLTRAHVPALTLVGSGSRDDDAKLEARYEEGHRWFKIKLGMGPAEVELETIRNAIALVGTSGVVCGDANEAWGETEAAAFLEALDGSGVRFIEQPIGRENPSALARLAATSPVPVCADESAGSLEAVLALANTRIRGVSLKLIKHGGITGVMRGAAICASAGMEVNIAGKVIESSISAAANLHCAAAMDSIEFGCSPSNQGVVADVCNQPIAFADGGFRVPSGPGLGVDVDLDLVAALAD